MSADGGDGAADLTSVFQILDHAPQAVVAVRPDWTVLWLNLAGHALLAGDVGMPAGRPVTDLLVDDGAFRRFRATCQRTGHGRAIVVTRQSGGASTPVAARGWRSGPGADAPVLLCLDPDDAEAWPAGRPRDSEALARIAGSLAHEYNNVLTVILCGSANLRDELDPADPRRSLVDDIENAGLRAADLTRQLLACSRFA